MKKEKMLLNGVLGLVGIIFFLIVGIIIAKAASDSKEDKLTETTTEVTTEKIDETYESLAVIKQIIQEEEKIIFYDILKEGEITLNYTRGLNILDKYNFIIALSQINIGEIVDIKYISESSKLTDMQISKKAWEYKQMSNIKMEKSSKSMELFGEKYKYTESLLITSNNQSITLLELNEKDELTIKGVDKQVYSIIVDKGHGIIRLVNYDALIGGTIEVGYDIILPITEGLVILAREGNYKVSFENEELKGVRNINVLRNQEVIIDLSEYKKEVVKVGGIDFFIMPIGADLYIDGEEKEYEDIIMLNYGTHHIEVKLTGYTTYSEDIVIDSPYLELSIYLKNPLENTNDDDEQETTLPTTETTTTTTKSSTASSTANTTTTASTTEYEPDDYKVDIASRVDDAHRIYIETPKNAQVSFDAVKKGESPVDFTKVTGEHVITFSRSGYITKSYSIIIADDGEDVYYSFPELIAK